MRMMKKVREGVPLTKSRLSHLSGVDRSFIHWIEERGFIPYEPQLERIASALGYDGDPHDLLEEVEV